MRSALTVLSLLAIAFLAMPAVAQTSLPGGVLTEEERAVIKDYFGKKLGEVMGTRKASDAEGKRDSKADDDDDDRDARKAKGKKHKGKKAKGKGHGKGMPPGLAKRRALPPGLQRQLDERGALPPGLASRDLPEDLEAKLPPVKEDFKRVIVDEDVVLIERGTNRVLDILEGVITGRGKK